MSQLRYGHLHPRVEAALADALHACTDGHPAPEPAWGDAIRAAQALLDAPEGRLRIAIVGEYSAGKSSLIKVLTGADVVIDADVATTDTSDYEWNGVTLIDTPGVQAEQTATDHDRIAREATRDADLVLFVLTNELFTPRLAEHLQYLVRADGLGLAPKLALIVNKMDRENSPDEVITGEIIRVVDEVATLPIWFCSTRSHLRASSADESRRARLERDSRVGELVRHIDTFVQNAGTTGRLLTPLGRSEDAIGEAMQALVPDEADKLRLELTRRQRRLLNELNERVGGIGNRWKQRARTVLVKAAEDADKRVKEQMDASALDGIFEGALLGASADLNVNFEGFAGELKKEYEATFKQLEALGETPLAQRVIVLEAQRGDQVVRPETKGGKAPSDKARGTRAFKEVLKPLDKHLGEVVKNPDEVRRVIYEMGKKVGYKFRPWEAVGKAGKVVKAAGAVGKAMPYLAIALDLYINYKEEQAKEKRAQHLAEMRIALRRAFTEQADSEAGVLDEAAKTFVQQHVSAAIAALDAHETEITKQAATRASTADKLNRVRETMRMLRMELTMSDNGADAPSVHL